MKTIISVLSLATFVPILSAACTRSTRKKISHFGEYFGYSEAIYDGYQRTSQHLMIIPSMMIFLSLLLNSKVNRLLNIIVGIIYLVVLASTFFTGRNPAYYLFIAAVKAVLLVSIVWQAWNWPRKDA